MPRRLAFVLLVFGTISGGAVTAQERGPFDEIYVSNIWSDPAHCNLGRARRVAFDMLLRDYRSLHGCFAVRGVWGAGGLYRNAADARLGEGLDGSEISARWIGLYGRREIMGLNYRRARVEVVAVGTLGDCRTWTEREVNVVGYCHSLLEGPYLALAEMYLEP